LVGRAHALLLELDWRGLANLQFLTPNGGSPHLIDCNGRFYGSLALAVAAGANLPAIWAADAMGLPTAGPVTGRPGVRYQSFQADLLRARRAPRRGRMREVVGTVSFAFRATHSTWHREDPLPLLGWLSHRAAGRLGDQAVRCRTMLRDAVTRRRSPRGTAANQTSV
jgi:predicted ATP-grasp superfamily ATP-dependent carboligase